MHDFKKEKEYVPMWSSTEIATPIAKEYKTVVNVSPEVFDGEVNFFLKRGWQLYGLPRTLLTPTSKTHLLVQTLVLYEDMETETSVS